MGTKLGRLMSAMVEYEAGCPQRVNHFMKVYAFAKAIAEAEGLSQSLKYTLEVAALVHDAGIKPSLEKYGSSEGSHQEAEGPPAARKLMEAAGIDPEVVERVCFLVGHHHTYSKIDGPDYQILVEADFLVNCYEDKMERDMVEQVKHNLFKTKSGVHYLENLFL